VADTTIGFTGHFEAGIGSYDIGLGLEAPSAADSALVEGLRTGVESAYELLIMRYQQPVYNLVYRLLSDPADASDVVQEVFLKVFRNVGSFRGQSSLKTWIYRIAVNEAHNQRRWFSRHRKQEVGLEGEEEGALSYHEKLSDHGRSPYDEVLTRETQEMIEHALQGINPIFRSAVVLRDIEDLSYEDIAEILQVNLGTVKSRILRGRDGLRKALADRLQAGRELHGLSPQAAD
jgi:RNA polymerase sigma-70 factor (ECF subfamily)